MTFSWHPRKSWLWDKSKNCIFGSRTGSCFSYGLQCNLLLLLTTLGYLEYLCFSLRPIFFNPCCALESSLVEASGSAGKESACHAGDTGDMSSIPGSGKIPWRRKWEPTPVFLPEKSHGQRSLAGHSPKCCRVGHN